MRDALKISAEQIFAALADEIRDGRLADGGPLPPERELCTRFGVSRPTVRAALHLLGARGFAILEPTKRPRAHKPTLARVFDIVGRELSELLGDAETMAYLDQIRQFIEVGAVRQAAREASNLEITQIHAALERCFGALDDDGAFARADAEFHRSIVAVVQNPLILELHDRFVGQILASRAPNSAPNAESNRASYEEHRTIYEAISAGNGEDAISLMEQHLAKAYRNRLAAPARLGDDRAKRAATRV